jgi:hypothetical protein
MNLAVRDYNGADRIFSKASRKEWTQLEAVLAELPLCLKPSDQAGRQGSPIFDPVATNAFIRDRLRERFGWKTNIPISSEYRFLGLDVDAGKNGVMLEVQFSNYPFLLNNMLRGELFYKGRFSIGEQATSVALIVTKGGMFPASNSTLYYEQASQQLDALAKNKVFTVPLRLVGLMGPQKGNIKALWTEAGVRYSRDLSSQRNVVCEIQPGGGLRCRIQIRSKT